ncbi:MAG: hypothetical protein WBM45_13810 [Woeseiaceae bacterium]|jgi:hypothetical protein
MINKYKKKDAPTWQRKLVVILGALSAATILLFAAWAVLLLIDRA